MSRVAAATPEVRRVPTNDVYTVLVLVAILAELLAFVAMFMRAGDIFGPNGSLFS